MRVQRRSGRKRRRDLGRAELKDYFQSGETRKVSPRKLKTEEWAALGTMRNERRINKLGSAKGCHAGYVGCALHTGLRGRVGAQPA